MPIGNEGAVTQSSINTTIGDLAMRWHDLATDTLAAFGTLNQYGAAGLQNFGFDTQDAIDVFNAANYMQTIAQIWFGTATQVTDFDFDTQAVVTRARGLVPPS